MRIAVMEATVPKRVRNFDRSIYLQTIMSYIFRARVYVALEETTGLCGMRSKPDSLNLL